MRIALDTQKINFTASKKLKGNDFLSQRNDYGKVEEFRMIWNQTDPVRLLFHINRKVVNTIWFWFDLIRFRKYFSACENVVAFPVRLVSSLATHLYFLCCLPQLTGGVSMSPWLILIRCTNSKALQDIGQLQDFLIYFF